MGDVWLLFVTGCEEDEATGTMGWDTEGAKVVDEPCPFVAAPTAFSSLALRRLSSSRMRFCRLSMSTFSFLPRRPSGQEEPHPRLMHWLQGTGEGSSRSARTRVVSLRSWLGGSE